MNPQRPVSAGLADSDEEPEDQLRGYSIIYCLAIRTQQGRKPFTLQTLPGFADPFGGRAGRAAGYSLHAGVAVKANQRDKVRVGTDQEAAQGVILILVIINSRL